MHVHNPAVERWRQKVRCSRPACLRKGEKAALSLLSVTGDLTTQEQRDKQPEQRIAFDLQPRHSHSTLVQTLTFLFKETFPG